MTVVTSVPLPAVLIGWHTPLRVGRPLRAGAARTILGGGRSSRLDRLLVNSENPLAVAVSAMQLAARGRRLFGVSATVMQGKDAEEVEKMLVDGRRGRCSRRA